MKLSAKSPVTGKYNVREIAITVEQLSRWRAGEKLQNVAPELSPEDREFIISGCTPEDWETLFGKGE